MAMSDKTNEDPEAIIDNVLLTDIELDSIHLAAVSKRQLMYNIKAARDIAARQESQLKKLQGIEKSVSNSDLEQVALDTPYHNNRERRLAIELRQYRYVAMNMPAPGEKVFWWYSFGTTRDCHQLRSCASTMCGMMISHKEWDNMTIMEDNGKLIKCLHCQAGRPIL